METCFSGIVPCQKGDKFIGIQYLQKQLGMKWR